MIEVYPSGYPSSRARLLHTLNGVILAVRALHKAFGLDAADLPKEA